MKATKQPETDSNDHPQYMKARAVARRFGLCKRTVFRLADAGKLHRHKLGERAVFFELAEVEALFAASRIGGETDNASKRTATN